jgi:hypothetical protein
VDELLKLFHHPGFHSSVPSAQSHSRHPFPTIELRSMSG